MIEFIVSHERNKNFTPWGLIVKYCKAAGLRYGTTPLSTNYVDIDGNKYTYDHYIIEDHHVKVYLRLWKKAEA